MRRPETQSGDIFSNSPHQVKNENRFQPYISNVVGGSGYVNWLSRSGGQGGIVLIQELSSDKVHFDTEQRRDRRISNVPQIGPPSLEFFRVGELGHLVEMTSRLHKIPRLWEHFFFFFVSFAWVFYKTSAEWSWNVVKQLEGFVIIHTIDRKVWQCSGSCTFRVFLSS